MAVVERAARRHKSHRRPRSRPRQGHRHRRLGSSFARRHRSHYGRSPCRRRLNRYLPRSTRKPCARCSPASRPPPELTQTVMAENAALRARAGGARRARCAGPSSPAPRAAAPRRRWWWSSRNVPSDGAAGRRPRGLTRVQVRGADRLRCRDSMSSRRKAARGPRRAPLASADLHASADQALEWLQARQPIDAVSGRRLVDPLQSLLYWSLRRAASRPPRSPTSSSGWTTTLIR